MVLCGSAVQFSSVDELPGLSLPSHVQVVFHNCCCHGNCVQLNVQANLSPKFGGLKGSGFSAADILAVAV